MANHHRLIDSISTQSLMLIIFFFSYIFDIMRETYLTPTIFVGHSEHEQQIPPPASKMIEANSKLAKQTRESLSKSCLARMPSLLRLYAYFSTLSHIMITSKYIILSAVKYHLVPNKDEWACYLPGRVSFLSDLAYELPGLAIMMSASHLVWRSFWYILYKQLSLEALIFIVHEDDSIEGTRNELRRKFAKMPPAQQEQMYELNRLFCQKIQTVHGQTEYLLRNDRELRRKRKLDNLIRSISVIMLMNTIIFGTPLSIIMLLNILSPSYFEINYHECRAFSLQANNCTATSQQTACDQLWSFGDPYRVAMFLGDSFDNFMIIFDSASGLTWPLVTSIIVALDLTISMDEISQRIALILESLVDKGAATSHSVNKLKSSSEKRFISRQSAPRRDPTEAMEWEILILQSDIMIVFDNVRKVDRYINTFAAYAIIFWVTINVTFEVIYFSRRQEISFNATVVLVQSAALILLTFAFFHLGRSHNKTIKLYHLCCELMAQDPFTKTTKRSWVWLLEYYEPHKSLYSLHMGWTVLTFTNYIKFMLYSITFSIVLINLLQQEFY